MQSTHGTPAQEAMLRRRQELGYDTPCQTDDPNIWDPPGSTSKETGKTEREIEAYNRIMQALKGCAQCLVKQECLELLFEEGDHARGVWAGIVKYDPLYPVLNRKVKELLTGD